MSRGKKKSRSRGAKDEPQQPRIGRSKILRFCGLFLALVTVAHFLLNLDLAWRSLRDPYCKWLATVCGVILHFVGVGADVDGEYINSGPLSVKIARDCDGLNAAGILTAAILAFPGRWKARWIGLTLGLLAIFLVNVLRIAALFLIGMLSSRIFDVVHVYVFQAFIIAIAVGYFVWWAQAATSGRLAD